MGLGWAGRRFARDDVAKKERAPARVRRGSPGPLDRNGSVTGILSDVTACTAATTKPAPHIRME